MEILNPSIIFISALTYLGPSVSFFAQLFCNCSTVWSNTAHWTCICLINHTLLMIREEMLLERLSLHHLVVSWNIYEWICQFVLSYLVLTALYFTRLLSVILSCKQWWLIIIPSSWDLMALSEKLDLLDILLTVVVVWILAISFLRWRFLIFYS